MTSIGPFILTLATALSALVFFSGCSGGLERAQTSYRVGDYERARRLFEAELDRHPDSFEARYGYAVVLQEMSLKKKSRGEDQIEDWMDVVKEYEICARLGEADSFSENYAISLFHL